MNNFFFLIKTCWRIFWFLVRRPDDAPAMMIHYGYSRIMVTNMDKMQEHHLQQMAQIMDTVNHTETLH